MHHAGMEVPYKNDVDQVPEFSMLSRKQCDKEARKLILVKSRMAYDGGRNKVRC